MLNSFQKKSWIVWLLFAAIAILVFTTYFFTVLNAASGEIIMPLDDVYIHFQYAKQLATGQPYVYNPGQPPTSGATSFLYPYILAFGYSIGFQELNLGLWSMLVGTIALFLSIMAIYRLSLALDVPDVLALIGSITFAATGLISWHFMSGMETGLITAFSLWTLYFFIKQNPIGFGIAASLFALIRPEGSIMAVIASGLFLLRTMWHKIQNENREISTKNLLILVPIGMLFLQPLVNYWITGTAVASGNSAKSLLGIIPQDYGLIISRIAENFLCMWWEFFIGYSSERGILLLPPLLSLLAVVGLIRILINPKMRWNGTLIVIWLLIVSAAISTLDTAFWHFRRYQIPLMALFFPLAFGGLTHLYERLSLFKGKLKHAFPAIWFIFASAIFVNFVLLHHLNVSYVYDQPYQMALWLDENTATDSVVAVHDVGMMRYMGRRTTLDIVGLTTPGAAQYWRSGPGAVGEFILQNQPDYIASYGRGHGYGLYMLADSILYDEILAEFQIEDWNRQANVALAADSQGIYAPDWTAIEQSETEFFSPYINEIEIADAINVTNLQDEEAHLYQWISHIEDGFITEFRQFPHLSGDEYVITDGLRRINGEESFVLNSQSANTNHLLITRLHPLSAGTLDIYINDEHLARQWIPQIPGYWLDIATHIPAQFSGEPLNIRIVPIVSGGTYQPAYHALVPFTESHTFTENPVASYQDARFELIEFDVQQENISLAIDFYWQTDGNAEGDYRFFVHLYDDVNQPPIAQYDAYPYGNTLPVGNWIQGGLHDRIGLDLSGVSSGSYQLAIGFYDPLTQVRLLPTSDTLQISDDGRLFLGTVEIMGDG